MKDFDEVCGYPPVGRDIWRSEVKRFQVTDSELPASVVEVAR